MKMQKVENYDEIKMLDLEISFKNHSANQMHFSAVHFKLQKKKF
jgi:competence transcription factor ComK